MNFASQNIISTWLDQQCEVLDGTIRAVVLFSGVTENSFQPSAKWPRTSATTPALMSAATQAIRTKNALLFQPDSVPGAAAHEGDIIACPITDKDKVLGVVAVEVECRPGRNQISAREALRSNIDLLKSLVGTDTTALDEDAAGVLDLIATCIEKSEFEAATRALLARFAAVADLRQASIGMLRKGRIVMQAVSGRSSVDAGREVNRKIAAAMMEAIELDESIVVSRETASPDPNSIQNTALLDTLDSQSICTIPFVRDGEIVGAFVLEHDDAKYFNDAKMAYCEAVVALSGALLHDKYLHDRSPAEKFLAEATRVRRAFTGRGKRWRTAAFLMLAAVLTLPFFLTGHYKVTADATLEGRVQRVVAAPVAGYILASTVRPGDIVTTGDSLARLDDRDLELERVRLSSEKNRLDREYRSAIAAHDSPKVAVVKAQIDRARAELQLTEQRLERVRIVAPMDGVIVNGDLSQQLGAPVEKGQLLFEIAPLDEYRVMLEVDEREIGALSPGQDGQLALVGLPGKPLSLTVDRITPISSQAEGRNFFLVEARLAGSPGTLRPGMDGIAKIGVGDRRLVWIWTHKLTDWFSLVAWRWLG